MTITAEKNREGYWVLSDIIDGHLVTRRYLYYTKKQAINHFKRQIKRRTRPNYGESINEKEEDAFFDKNWKDASVMKRRKK
jgi:hypothetical protein